MNITKDQLIAQFNHSITPEMKAAFIETGTKYRVEPALLMAIASRETNFNPHFLNHPGDNGNGFGLCQIDRHSFPEFCASEDWKDPVKNIDMAGRVLADKRSDVSNRLTLHHTNPTPGQLLACYVAAYNAGARGAVEAFIDHGDPDRATTGHDYSADTIERYRIFASLLGVENA